MHNLGPCERNAFPPRWDVRCQGMQSSRRYDEGQTSFWLHRIHLLSSPMLCLLVCGNQVFSFTWRIPKKYLTNIADPFVIRQVDGEWFTSIGIDYDALMGTGIKEKFAPCIYFVSGGLFDRKRIVRQDQISPETKREREGAKLVH